MESAKYHDPGNTEMWAPITRIAECLNCSLESMHGWGEAKYFGYRRVGPRKTLVNVVEVLAFYTSKYPKVEINYEVLAPYMQPTA